MQRATAWQSNVPSVIACCCLLSAAHCRELCIPENFWWRSQGIAVAVGKGTEDVRGTLQRARDAALEGVAALEAEKAQLKAGLGGALEQRQALEAQLAALTAKQHSLCQAVRLIYPAESSLMSMAYQRGADEANPLHVALWTGQCERPRHWHAVQHETITFTGALTGAAAAQAEAAAAREAEASQRAEQAAQDAAEVRELAQREAAAHEIALQEASQKAARLARLEGASPTA